MPVSVPIARLPSDWTLSQRGLGLIKGEEGLQLVAYRDVGGILTIGYGSTRDVTEGMVITEAEAETRLMADTLPAQAIVRSGVKVKITLAQYEALTSLAFNTGRLPPSLLACINGGLLDSGKSVEACSWQAAAEQFPRNCRAKVMQKDLSPQIPLSEPILGLYKRRMAEAIHFSGLPWQDAINGVRMTKERVRDATGAWAYKIDTEQSTSLATVIQRAHQAASVAGIPDEPEGLAVPEADTPAPESPVPAGPKVAPAPPTQPPSPNPAPQVTQGATVTPIAGPPVALPGFSKDAIGNVLIGAGSMGQVLAKRGILGSTAIVGALNDATRDPVIVALLAGGIFWGLMWLTKHYGHHQKAKGAA